MTNKVIPVAPGLEIRIDSDAVWLSCSFGSKKGLINISDYPGNTSAAYALRDVCCRMMEEKRAAGPITVTQHTHPDVGAFDEGCPACLEDISQQNASSTTSEMLAETVLALTKAGYFAQDLLWSVNNLIESVHHEIEVKEAYKHDLQLYESQQNPCCWVVSHLASKSTLNLSEEEGWEVVATEYDANPFPLEAPMTAGMRLLTEAAEDFCSKVERGDARRTRTYNRFKKALEAIHNDHVWKEPPEAYRHVRT